MSNRRATRPLNEAAAQAADEEIYARHQDDPRPNALFDADGNRLPLDANDPAQADLRSEWMDAYVAHGGEVEGQPDDDDSDVAPDDTEQPCPLAGGDDTPEATITCRWSKADVTPDHNNADPPASPPTDVVPDEAKVELIVDTTNVPDGTAATIEIRSCATGEVVHEGTLSNLEVRGNQVVSTDTGNRPEWVFQAAHQPWDSWNAPYFYFHATVDYQGLEGETPSDHEANEADCLRVVYWHVCYSDSTSLSGVAPECNTVAAILKGVAHSRSQAVDHRQESIPLAQYGSHIRNTYVFHQASHGDALNRSAPHASITTVTSSLPPDDVSDPANWRSIVYLTPMPRFGDAEIGTEASVPSVPRYLWYSSTCLTGWESSFADALIARGCRNVIAFRVTIPDSEAPEMARDFYTQWANDYQLDPEKIPDCFFQAGADHYRHMRPILYGAGGGQITGLSTGAIVAIAIAAIAVGAVIGIGLYALLRD